ncbi:hypothetical protein [Kineosporia babensis]|uniref:Integral membrane protein n=1 Tax=Kineosporia babensis TaxID=499548 RepID=A0A9X1SSG8_9ACTN|nr:hypothetical protein [Kineosporia babensis]MCD5310569.1 hypothetical protein [Kineosporia babensis]
MPLTAEAPSLTTTSQATSRLYLIRAGLALLWAGSLGAALSSAGTLTAESTLPVLASVLLFLYPVLDVVSSLVDVRAQRSVGNTANVRAQLVNAAISGLTALAVVLAIGQGPASVLRVFGTWAVLTGVIQLALAVNRRRQGLRGQWAMILSGGLSAVIGLTFFMAATETEIKLGGVAGYAVGGAILYLVSAFRLHRAARSAAG